MVQKSPLMQSVEQLKQTIGLLGSVCDLLGDVCEQQEELIEELKRRIETEVAKRQRLEVFAHNITRTNGAPVIVDSPM